VVVNNFIDWVRVTSKLEPSETGLRLGLVSRFRAVRIEGREKVRLGLGLVSEFVSIKVRVR